MSKIITNGAKMECTLGASPVPIIVTSQTFVKINGGIVATEADKAPMANVPTFGACKCASPNPPCVPSPIAWLKTSLIHSINGNKSLTQESFCMCANGGKITFVDTGSNNHVETK
ncbi:DUF4280 domain-containing protein [Dysgonomonas sp. 25]|uniref:DUF4280 domain-containing protein n=1 Tax=Dysgonomonas sp. 25 TaxID=2302933 RepID=UPI0013D39D8B|nr:DUF4280 domain-containing protein [Dysgonomonas sp. 25]NDV68616.1 DUF4280 domain-containing protein [Dysgonomonas sp. 25]